MVPIMATLVLGLLLTTGFAALVIGTLNLISVAFAVLFVGIAVDFAIQFTVRLRERRFTYPDMTEALRETGRRSGAQILVAALATASGFLAFTPTNFVGVAQLGIIAGFGMVIAFGCTLTFLPAMLCLCHPTAGKARGQFRLRPRAGPGPAPLSLGGDRGLRRGCARWRAVGPRDRLRWRPRCTQRTRIARRSACCTT